MASARISFFLGFLFTLLLTTSLACDNRRAPPFEGRVSRSASFEYHEESAVALCPTQMPLLDRHLSRFEALTGLHLTPPVFRYYSFATYEGLFNYGCPSNCTIDDVIYAIGPFETHELVHAYVHRAMGPAISIGLLEEGLATAFACDPSRNGNSSWGDDWRNVIHVAETTADIYRADTVNRYAAAGSFVAYLFYTFGWEKLSSLYRSVHRGDNATALEKAVLSIYAVDMDTLWRDSLSFHNRRICITDWTCWSSPLVLNQQVGKECDDEIHRSIELSQPSSVAIFATSPVMLWEDCLAEPGPIVVLGQNTSASVSWVSLPAGSFNLTKTSGSMSASGPYYPKDFSLKLSAQFPGDFLAASCEEAPAIPLDPQIKTRILFPRTSNLNGWVRLDGSAASGFSIVTKDMETSVQPGLGDGGIPGDISFCDGCSQTAQCQVITPYTSFSLTGSGILRLTNVFTFSSPESGFPNAAFIISPMQ